jgi:Spy/CpxP family protein refolding chaperone
MKMDAPKVFCVLGFCLLLATGAGARALQSAGSAGSSSHSTSAKGPSNSPEAIENDEALSLTQEQKDKVAYIRSAAKQQMSEVEKDKTLTDDQRTKKMKQITKETRAQVFAVLSPDQQKTWSAEQRERREGKKQPAK